MLHANKKKQIHFVIGFYAFHFSNEWEASRLTLSSCCSICAHTMQTARIEPCYSRSLLLEKLFQQVAVVVVAFSTNFYFFVGFFLVFILFSSIHTLRLYTISFSYSYCKLDYYVN